jgi:hypothetical protein
LGGGSGGSSDWDAPAPSVINETKVSIVAVMRQLDRAITSHELYSIWGKRKPLAVFDYHLSTLVRAGVAQLISGPELRFRFTNWTGAVSPRHPGTVAEAANEVRESLDRSR